MEFTFTTIPDTLVLKIIEHDVDTKREDSTVFILYDIATHRYVIRGQRNTTVREYTSYSYEANSSICLEEFLSFLFDRTNEFSFIMYSLTNLPESSNEITFDFLNDSAVVENEISGYDNQKYKRSKVLKNLRMLRNIFNYY